MSRTTMTIITPRQFELLRWLMLHNQHARAITIRQAMKLMSIASPNGLLCHIERLEKHGLVKRSEHCTPFCTLPWVGAIRLAGELCGDRIMPLNGYVLVGRDGTTREIAVRNYQRGAIG